MSKSAITYSVNGIKRLNIKGVQMEIYGSTFPKPECRDELSYALAEALAGRIGKVRHSNVDWLITRDEHDMRISAPYSPPRQRVVGTPLINNPVTRRMGVYLGQRV